MAGAELRDCAIAPSCKRVLGEGSERPIFLGLYAPLEGVCSERVRRRSVFNTEGCPGVDGVSTDWNSRPDGGATKRGAQYDGDPAQGKNSLLWETALPWWGRREGGDKPRCVARTMWEYWTCMQEGLGLTWTVHYGSVSAVHD
jgi:hypothetical protein